MVRVLILAFFSISSVFADGSSKITDIIYDTQIAGNYAQIKCPNSSADNANSVAIDLPITNHTVLQPNSYIAIDEEAKVNYYVCVMLTPLFIWGLIEHVRCIM